MATPSFRCLRNRREDCIGQFTAITWIIIHIFVLFHLPHLATGLEEPGFVSPLKNITTIVGRTTGFTCVTKNFGDHNTVRIIQGRHGTAGKAGKVWPLHRFWVSIHSNIRNNRSIKLGQNIGPCLAQICRGGPAIVQSTFF